MFSFGNAMTVEQLTKNPLAAFGKLFDLQRMTLAAIGEIIEGNGRTLRQLSTLRDPETLWSAQQSILTQALQHNLAVMVRAGEGWTAEIRAATGREASAG